MKEIRQAIKDYINEAIDEFPGGEEKLEIARQWDLFDDDRLIWETGYIAGLERALYKLNELRTDGEEE